MKHYSTAEIAEMLGVSPDKPRDWIADGSLPAINVARHTGGKARYRIAETDLADFLRRRRTQPPAPAPKRKKRQSEVTEYY
ncbi:MAG TPA: helix-turn-helix domain-containing protein [Pirellulaceae bacterium]|nr:helix-turn-helix domain-containing protein [Pirellulaceae bacterium]